MLSAFHIRFSIACTMNSRICVRIASCNAFGKAFSLALQHGNLRKYKSAQYGKRQIKRCRAKRSYAKQCEAKGTKQSSPKIGDYILIALYTFRGPHIQWHEIGLGETFCLCPSKHLQTKKGKIFSKTKNKKTTKKGNARAKQKSKKMAQARNTAKNEKCLSKEKTKKQQNQENPPPEPKTK